MNVQEVLPALLRMCDIDELAEHDSTTPTTLDYLASYRDGAEPLKYQIGRSNAVTAANAAGLTASGIAVGCARAVLLLPGDAPADVADVNPFAGTATQKFRSFATNVLSHDLNRPVVGGNTGRLVEASSSTTSQLSHQVQQQQVLYRHLTLQLCTSL